MTRTRFSDVTTRELTGRKVRVYATSTSTTALWQGVIKEAGPTYSSQIRFKVTENETYNVDGSVRKNSRSERTIDEYSNFWFADLGIPGEKVPVPAGIPTTAGELTDEHIGMRFKFNGVPTVEGVYGGLLKDDRHSLQIKITGSDRRIWESGYWIDTCTRVEFLGEAEKTVPGELTPAQVEAKLKAYTMQRIKDELGWNSGYQEAAAGVFIKIMKELTEAN
jgi:hypothetical protein